MEVSGIMTVSRCLSSLPFGSRFRGNDVEFRGNRVVLYGDRVVFRGNDWAVEGSFGKELLAWLI